MKETKEIRARERVWDIVMLAILLDDSRQNREFIGQVWGKVVVLDFKGQPIEESK